LVDGGRGGGVSASSFLPPRRLFGRRRLDPPVVVKKGPNSNSEGDSWVGPHGGVGRIPPAPAARGPRRRSGASPPPPPAPGPLSPHEQGLPSSPSGDRLSPGGKLPMVLPRFAPLRINPQLGSSERCLFDRSYPATRSHFSLGWVRANLILVGLGVKPCSCSCSRCCSNSCRCRP